ncbi:hypothetical protein FQN57_006767 [Myotisia sp. PD_48]|nr:hypothetical protein FQN57_006767 [Myotisia sp. PD_48]
MVSNYHHKATVTKYPGIRDKHVLELDLSLGQWMIRIAGYNSPANDLYAEYAEPQKFVEWTVLMNRYQRGEQINDKLIIELRQETEQLRKYVLQKAHIIACTLTNAGGAWMRKVLKPDVIVVDEAAKARESEMWNILSDYRPIAILLAGDQNQLRPFVQDSPAENNFALQMSISLFLRLITGGFPYIMFRTQHRMQKDICDMVSSLSYSGKLETANLSVEHQEMDQRVLQYNERKFGKPSNILFLSDEKSVTEQSPHTGSRTKYDASSTDS